MIKEQKGQSLVEFALLLPLLLLLICGIVDMGRLMFAYVSLNMTTQEAVRLGGLGRSDADIRYYAETNLRVGDPSKITVKITPELTPGQSTRKSGLDMTVTLTYSLPLITPLMTEIMPAPVLSANSTIRKE
jgi:Flp pilus assembly protein TadG